MSIEKTTEIKSMSSALPAKVSVVPKQSSKPLYLSIDDVSIENEVNNDDIYNIEYRHTEKRSALFKALQRKQTEHSLNFSGKLLTDKYADDTQHLLKSVNGVQINIQGSFN